ncbi:RHS repeat protein [Desulfofarcimen acetoxidans]|uniref:RHS repeat protein n=1 Tax=Desulfofarcimen acetoxidans TaxID=58138 RepID=UPI001A98B1DB|nr:RHS repeat protein [Desulfofarcimen acetoxidans]
MENYIFDAFGNMTSYTDPLADRDGYGDPMDSEHTTTYTYPTDRYHIPRSKTWKKDAAATLKIEYDFTSNGNVTQERKIHAGNNLVSDYRYDNCYDYDAAGNRKSMTDATGTTTYNYYNNNWLKDVIKGGVTQIHYEYDDVGNIFSVTDKKGFITSYRYDSCSRMYTVTFSGKTTIYTYDANGNRQSITYPGGTKEEYAYNKNNKLLTLTNKNPGGGVISNYSYTYYDNGLQNTRTDSCGTTTYTYCPAGQIKTVTAPGKTTVYTYDGAGNRQTASETYASDQSSGYTNDDGSNIKYRVKSSQYLYSNTGKLLSIVESMRDAAGSELLQKKTGYTYDKNGNQTHSLAEFLKPAATGTMETINIGAYSDNIKQPLDSTIEITDNTYDGFNRLKKAETTKSGKRAVA